PDGGTDYIRRPVLPTRLAEWDKELMRFVRQAEERGRYDRQHDCMASDCLPCGPAKSTVAEEGQDAIPHCVQDFVADVSEHERWQVIFRVRLSGQKNNRSGIEHHWYPVPEHLI